jgi:hypothetical protein
VSDTSAPPRRDVADTHGMPLPYPDPRVALATLHGKADALAPALEALGLKVETVAIDTDALGTFAGDIERPGTAHEVVIEKARRGMAISGLKLGIATEGSFGPDPLLGFLPLHTELLAFVDDEHGQTIVVEHAGHDTNWVSKAVRPGDDLQPLLASIGLPTHAALVKPNRWTTRLDEPLPVAKGLIDPAAVTEATERMAARSEDGLARIEADMRAHRNPTRLAAIGRLGHQLAQRLATPCPCCGAPGFGRVDARLGLPCELCGEATDLVRAEIHGCGVCGHREDRPRADGLSAADAGHCPECNP